RMTQQRGGVILTVTSGSSKGQGPLMGSTGAADAATESLVRSLAAEVGPAGVRVVGIWTAGVPETFRLADDTNLARRGTGMSPDDIERVVGSQTMLGRAPRLAQVADTAAFLASDHAAGITGSVVAVNCGLTTTP